MDAAARQLGEEAVAALDRIVREGPKLPHHDVAAAVRCVIAFRNRLIESHRAGAATRACLDRANSLASLGFGAEYPLIGFHLHRIEQTRDHLQKLLADE